MVHVRVYTFDKRPTSHRTLLVGMFECSILDLRDIRLRITYNFSCISIDAIEINNIFIVIKNKGISQWTSMVIIVFHIVVETS